MRTTLIAAAAVCIGAGVWVTAAPSAQAAPCGPGPQAASAECRACQAAATPYNAQAWDACFGVDAAPGPVGPGPNILGCAGAKLTGIPYPGCPAP
jgi:hypothetical protein